MNTYLQTVNELYEAYLVSNQYITFLQYIALRLDEERGVFEEVGEHIVVPIETKREIKKRWRNGEAIKDLSEEYGLSYWKTHSIIHSQNLSKRTCKLCHRPFEPTKGPKQHCNLCASIMKNQISHLRMFMPIMTLPNETIEDRIGKLYEEVAEVDEATTESEEKLKEELFDLLQATINTLYLLGVSEEDFHRHYRKMLKYQETKYPEWEIQEYWGLKIVE